MGGRHNAIIKTIILPPSKSKFLSINLFILLVWECDARIRESYSQLMKAILCVAAIIYLVALTKVQNINLYE